jgi:hypothetical protein
MGVRCVHVGLEQRAFKITRALMCASQCFMHHPICKDNGTVHRLYHGTVSGWMIALFTDWIMTLFTG